MINKIFNSFDHLSDINNMSEEKKLQLDLKELLKIMVKKKASDLHLKVGAPPILRKDRFLGILDKELPALSNAHLEKIIDSVIKPHQKEILLENKQVDFSYGIASVGRFRFNIFFQRGTLRVVVRYIPHEIPNFESLNLPIHIKNILNKVDNGLILVTGATGSGKSSTIVAMIDHINQIASKHIITIEDPIEFLIQDRKSLISQRELGEDYLNYKSALKSSLRQDPDIIFFGELRDNIEMEAALNAANTGHLVLSTCHTTNVAETVTRILGMFEKDKQRQIRAEFASSLRAIICQRLLTKKDETGVVPALEIMINNPRVRAILEDVSKSGSVFSEVIEAGKFGWGMTSFNQSIKELYQKGIISKEEALRGSSDPEKMKLHFAGLDYDNNSSNEHTSTKTFAQTEEQFDHNSSVNELEQLTLEEEFSKYSKQKKSS